MLWANRFKCCIPMDSARTHLLDKSTRLALCCRIARTDGKVSGIQHGLKARPPTLSCPCRLETTSAKQEMRASPSAPISRRDYIAVARGKASGRHPGTKRHPHTCTPEGVPAMKNSRRSSTVLPTHSTHPVTPTRSVIPASPLSCPRRRVPRRVMKEPRAQNYLVFSVLAGGFGCQR